MNNSTVSKKRHLAKAITWRITASTETFLLGWLITGSLQVGASISAIEMFSKTLLYYLHERTWYKMRWGVNEQGEETITSELPKLSRTVVRQPSS